MNPDFSRIGVLSSFIGFSLMYSNLSIGQADLKVLIDTIRSARDHDVEARLETIEKTLLVLMIDIDKHLDDQSEIYREKFVIK